MSPAVAVDELLDGLHVVTLPLRTRFRGVTEREVALVRGPRGWGESVSYTHLTLPTIYSV